MKYIIHGMGCPVSGGRVVLEELIKSIPHESRALVLVPFKDYQGLKTSRVKFVLFKHSRWGRYLRPFVDLYANLYLLFDRSAFLINASNYGLTFFSRSALYFHNPLLLDENEGDGFGRGRSNFLIRYALHQSLTRSKLIIVQTDHVKEQLFTYMRRKKIDFNAEIRVLKPKHILSEQIYPLKQTVSESFKMFYPANDFPHKRIDLAVSSVKNLGNVKLNLTTSEKLQNRNIEFLGKISYSRLIEEFQSSHALLFTSERETLGLPMLEALEFCIPAVLPNLPYAREIYGDAGVYFDEFTPDSVSKAITYLIDNYEHLYQKVIEQKRISYNSRKSWKEHWSIIQQFHNK